jgi:hypothetical protein
MPTAIIGLVDRDEDDPVVFLKGRLKIAHHGSMIRKCFLVESETTSEVAATVKQS